MIISDCTADDISVLAALHKASQRESERGVILDADLDRKSLEEFQSQWRTWIADGDIFKKCVRAEDRVIQGFILYGRVKTRPDFDRGVVPRYGAEVYALYVHPDHFRKGVGKALFIEACTDLAERKLSSLILWALKKNRRACAFYDALKGERIAKQRVEMGERSWAEESCFAWRDVRKILCTNVPSPT